MSTSKTENPQKEIMVNFINDIEVHDPEIVIVKPTK